MEFMGKLLSKRIWFVVLLMVVATSVVGYAAIRYFTLDIPSNFVVVSADPGLELIASDNVTVVTSIAFGNIVQGETGTWSGYLNNTGNVALRTFSIASPDLGYLGAVAWDIPVSGYLDVGQMCAVSITLTINQTADVGSHVFSIHITGSPTITGPTKMVIKASDDSDGYLRDWDLTFDRAMSPDPHEDADVIENHYSGDTMTVSWTLSAGPHYLMFAVGQSGGPGYGTYSGTITINGQVYNFSGVDNDHPVRIDFSV